MTRSYYTNIISDFLTDDSDKILGQLLRNHDFAAENLQRNAWIKQIEILKSELTPFKNGQIYFEFSIPRMGKRVDNILIIDDFIFVIEFKVGDTEYQKHAIEQTVDYCLDLQNFHEGSHHEKIVPILVSTKAPDFENSHEINDNLFEPLKGNQNNIAQIINQTLLLSDGPKINPTKWENSIYKPTPTIIEASQALYRGHSVSEISRSDAGAINLSKTTECINRVIEKSKAMNSKSICFLTGVPGAGKTLAGLNIANERRKAHEDENAVFLSGNGPLVYVLREALVRDEVQQAKEIGEKLTKKKSAIKANAFIQNIHHFRDDNLISNKAPDEKVVVFDEAQRAWTKEKATSFMKSKGKDFNMSEPEFLIDVMNRHENYCTIICLVGGGQEINTGEAGLSEWVIALKNHYPNWDIYFSNLITADNDYLNDKSLKDWLKENGKPETELHLSVSVRSFRSEKISSFVHEVIDGNAIKAKIILNEIDRLFPIRLTRDFNVAKEWLRKNKKGTERIGLVGSSGGRRLRPLGIDVKNEITAEDWFLNDATDVRSSHYLELVATEFDIQGLEIDYVCLAWDINFYFNEGVWNYQSFEGTRWKSINSEIDKSYLRNAYRVLMTRARQGLNIFIPYGDNLDPTRPKELYDNTYNFLSSCGIQTI
jgi:Cdc6-like AAA superfamily ATPase